MIHPSLKTILLAGLLTLLPASHGTAAPARPNIVVILCDDLGYSDVGFNGAKDITTPELDRLAGSGTIFSSAYVTHPFCGPSRAGLMTGRYPHGIGAQFNLSDTGEELKEGVAVSETLVSTVLQKAGYFTGAIGKWHLGMAPQFHPNTRGFDDFYGFLGGGHKYFPAQYVPEYEQRVKAGAKNIHLYVRPLEHNGKDVAETEYMTDGLSREAVRFVNEAAAKKKPFFLYLAYNAPHTPLEAKEEDLAKFASIENKDRRTYAAMVYAVDRGVGELVKALKTTGAFENTLIVFLSDNGGKLDAGARNAPLKAGKGSVYEGGYRVPMFFHWPANVPAGKRFDYPVSALDFYPTFARVAGATIPDGKVLDGKDVWSDVLAGRDPRKGEFIFALQHAKGYSDVGVRQDRWKAVRIGFKPWQLFDIETDLGEEKDVRAEHPAELERLVSGAEKWSRSHTEPRWFDTPQRGEDWKKEGMPKFQRTFKLE